jgi:ribosomal protein L11 methylase PrmA
LAVSRDPGSFRDPAGHVFCDGGRILRFINATAASDYTTIRDRGLLTKWIERGWVVGTRELERTAVGHTTAGDVRHVVEHESIRFVSHPYEWTFQGLRAAALLHLDLQLDAFADDIQLVDASAYNVQFDGPRPTFIDLLSFRRYREGDHWTAQRQFCEQFLNPLLLRALVGVPHNGWYRGSFEGIPAIELDAVLPAWRKASWNVFSHVTLPARLARTRRAANRRPARSLRPLPRASYRALLIRLREWIANLTPRADPVTTWSEYDESHPYSDEDRARKRAVVAEFVTHVKPALLWDIGCNTGEYSQLALEAGAAAVVGFEQDHVACEKAFARALKLRGPFLPLVIDVANPSPDQGWYQRERKGLAARGPADALLALAVTHHLAIGRNVPLEEVVRWLTAQAPAGIIEFVPKDDPMVRQMLESRTDIFDDYSEQAFATTLAQRARVIRNETISSSGRRLLQYIK